MDLPSFPSIYDPFSPQQHEIYQTSSSLAHLGVQEDILPQLNHTNNIVDDFLQIPIFTKNDELPKQRKTSLVLDDNEQDLDLNPAPSKKSKKIIHREIERQRRFEMSSLHASLRSLLPHDYTKGKRAMSDQVGEAVKYITHLQQNMKELHAQREALKRKVYLKTSKTRDRDVKVESCKGGVDVIVSTSCDDEGLPLSKVVQCLSQQGFDVVSCISKRLDNSNKLVHSIQAQNLTTEDEDEIKSADMDVETLHQKLKDL